MGKAYFDALNYTLANEDTAVEHAVLDPGEDLVVSVAGSGARVLPLLAKAPQELLCVDVSPAQLLLTELRVESVRALDHASFLAFWGYPGGDGIGEASCPPRPWAAQLSSTAATPGAASVGGAERKRMLASLTLSTEARAFAHELFFVVKDAAPIYAGRWERALGKLTSLARAVLGEHIERLFAHDDLAAQRAYVQTAFPWGRMGLVVHALGGAAVFNSILYAGKFPKKNTPGSAAGFYLDVFRNLFSRHLARDNYFLQLLLLGELRSPTGNPVECRADTFAAMKRGLAGCDVRYAAGDILEAAAACQGRAGLVSLSDVPSYFDDAKAERMLQVVGGGLRPGGRIVTRSYLHVPPRLDTRGFADVSARYDDVIAAEKVGVYSIAVHERSAA